MDTSGENSASHDWSIQPLNDAHRAALLRLNAANHPAVHTLDEANLEGLLACGGGHHRVAVDRTGVVCGYVLSFVHLSDYNDSEFRELRRRTAEPFLYICQVVVASGHRKRGIARGFYDALADTARHQGVALLCCDVNTNPPNPESFAFHLRMGFREIGRGTASNGFAIAYLQKRVRQRKRFDNVGAGAAEDRF